MLVTWQEILRVWLQFQNWGLNHLLWGVNLWPLKTFLRYSLLGRPCTAFPLGHPFYLYMVKAVIFGGEDHAMQYLEEFKWASGSSLWVKHYLITNPYCCLRCWQLYHAQPQVEDHAKRLFTKTAWINRDDANRISHFEAFWRTVSQAVKRKWQVICSLQMHELMEWWRAWS